MSRRRNYQRIWEWLTPENIAEFYRVVDEHRRRRAPKVRKHAAEVAHG